MTGKWWRGRGLLVNTIGCQRDFCLICFDCLTFFLLCRLQVRDYGLKSRASILTRRDGSIRSNQDAQISHKCNFQGLAFYKNKLRCHCVASQGRFFVKNSVFCKKQAPMPLQWCFVEVKPLVGTIRRIRRIPSNLLLSAQICRKRCQQVRPGTYLPHAPGVRMTVVN